MLRTSIFFLFFLILSGLCRGQDAPSESVLFEEVNIFDGHSERLLPNRHLLVEGNRIVKISEAPIPTAPSTRVIKGKGKTLMPGLIDVHVHLILCSLSTEELMSPQLNQKMILERAAVQAEKMVLRGFTSVRDVGGPSFALKMAIDQGKVSSQVLMETTADMDPQRQKKREPVMQGQQRLWPLAKKLGLKLAWGTDFLFEPELNEQQNQYLVKLGEWFSPREVLKMVTHDNAQLLALSGPRNPYPGKLGVVEEQALADLILIDGNPLEDLTLISRPEDFLLIMKDGKVLKTR